MHSIFRIYTLIFEIRAGHLAGAFCLFYIYRNMGKNISDMISFKTSLGPEFGECDLFLGKRTKPWLTTMCFRETNHLLQANGKTLPILLNFFLKVVITS